MKIITKTATKAARGKNLTLVWGIHPFPAGKILVALSADGLCWLGINCSAVAFKKNWPGAEFVEDQALTAKAAREIAKLWPQKMEQLSIPVALYGTAFQLKVWKELLKIKAGHTVTYSDIARKIGKPTAVRAVSSAIACNNVSVVVPCHRVVHSSGTQMRYLWGASIKKALLKGENAL